MKPKRTRRRRERPSPASQQTVPVVTGADCSPTLELPAPTGDAPGPQPTSRLGRYEVVGKLGAGAMGEVLTVWDATLGREVAVKVSRQAGARERFVQEARITGQLEHPGIVPVYELEPEGEPFFTMKRIDGEPLDAVLKRAARRPSVLPQFERLQIILKVCDAIAFAHSKRVIHRDLKPANILIGTFGEVVVCDWGLAKVVGEQDVAPSLAAARDAAIDETTATLDGTIKGTPAFMSPEQAEGRVAEIDERSDIYAIGALLYALLTCSPPFEGPLMQVLDLVGAGALEPVERRALERRQPAVPYELAAVVERAMSLEPDARYGSALELKADIQAYLEGGALQAVEYSISALAIKWLRRHKVAAVVAAAVLLSLIGGGVMLRLQAQTQRAAAERERLAAASAAGDEASAALQGHPTPDELLAVVKAAEGRRAESAADAAQQAALAAYLHACSAMERAVARAPEDAELRTRRRQAVLGLCLAATRTGDYTLAEQAISDLAALDAPATQLGELRVLLAAARGAQARWRRQQLERMFADLGKGIGGKDCHFRGWDIEDYVFEAAGYRDAATVERLSGRGDGLLAAMRGKPAWPDASLRTIEFLARVLSRLGMPELTIPVLSRWLATTDHADVQLLVARALCDTKDIRAWPALSALRGRVGISSLVWTRLDAALTKLPERGAASAEGGDESPQALRERARRLRDRREYREALRLFERLLPGTLDDRSDYLELLSLLARHADVISYSSELLKGEADPRLRAAWLSIRAQSRYGLDRADPRIDQDLAAAQEAAPKSARPYLCRARVALGRGQPDVAIAALRRADELDDSDARLHASIAMHTGEALLMQGKVKHALEQLDVAIEYGMIVGPRVLKAQAFSRMGMAADALAEIKQVLDRWPKHLPARLLRGEVLVVLGRFEQALVDIEAAIEGSRSPRHRARALAAKAQALMGQGDPASAEAVARRALGEAPDHSFAVLALAKVLRARGKVARGREVLEAAVARKPRDLSLICELAVFHDALGEPAKAEATLRKALAVSATHPVACYNLAQLRFKARDLDEAMRLISDALEIAPRSVDYRYLRALISSGRGQAQDALADLDAALEVDPKDLRCRVNRGGIYLKLRRYDLATADFRVASEQAGAPWQVWAGLGQALFFGGKRAEAVAPLRKAVAMAPAATRPALQRLLQQAGG